MHLSYTVFRLFVERRTFCLRGVYLEPLSGVIPQGPQLRCKRTSSSPEFWVGDANANCLTRILSYSVQNSPIHAISNKNPFFLRRRRSTLPRSLPWWKRYSLPIPPPFASNQPFWIRPASPRIPDCRFAPMVTSANDCRSMWTGFTAFRDWTHFWLLIFQICCYMSPRFTYIQSQLKRMESKVAIPTSWFRPFRNVNVNYLHSFLQHTLWRCAARNFYLLQMT